MRLFVFFLYIFLLKWTIYSHSAVVELSDDTFDNYVASNKNNNLVVIFHSVNCEENINGDNNILAVWEALVKDMNGDLYKFSMINLSKNKNIAARLGIYEYNTIGVINNNQIYYYAAISRNIHSLKDFIENYKKITNPNEIPATANKLMNVFRFYKSKIEFFCSLYEYNPFQYQSLFIFTILQFVGVIWICTKLGKPTLEGKKKNE